jgi:queuine tRNA-ribosyltransferase
MSLDCEVVLTRSGARAMLDRNTGEVMHPVVGPLAEATRLYVEPSRLRQRLRAPGLQPLVLFDVGLGAGSNAAAAFAVSEALSDSDRRLSIVSFEQSMAALELALAPEHAAAFGLEAGAGRAARALLEPRVYVGPRSEWRCSRGDVAATLLLEPGASADVVFWDPFSPRNNPSLWSVSIFQIVRRVCRTGATLHTYSGATQVRAALLLSGFCVGQGEKIAEGKHATCAALELADVARPLDRRWFERLSRSSAPFSSDAPGDALERIRALPQFAG